MKLKLNEDRFNEFIHTKMNNYECPICKSSHWGYSDKILTLNEYNEVFSVGTEFIPLIALMCNNCGNTILINPKIINSLDIFKEEHDAV